MYGYLGLALAAVALFCVSYAARRLRQAKRNETEEALARAGRQFDKLKATAGDKPPRGVQPLFSLTEYFLRTSAVAIECNAHHRATVHLKLVEHILPLAQALVEGKLFSYSAIDRLLIALNLLKQMKIEGALEELQIVWKEPSLPVPVRCLTLASVVWATRTQGQHGLAQRYEEELAHMPELLAECEQRGLNVSFVIE